MAELAIPIMRWGNWSVLTKVLKFRILQKIKDGKLDETELTQIIVGFIGDLEGIPSWLNVAADQIEKFASIIYGALNINWDVDLTSEQVNTIAEIIILALKYLR